MSINTYLIGREAESQALSHAIFQCKQGKEGFILLSGQAGIGKSTLLQQAIENKGVTLIQSRFFEESPLPFAPVIQALRHLMHEIPREKLQLQHFLGLLLPELGEPDTGTDRETLFSAIKEVFYYAATQQPLIWVIEDLHFADDSTLEVLLSIISGASQLPLLIIGTYRSEGLSKNSRLRWLRNELRRSKLLREIKLEHLDESGTRALVERTIDGKLNDELSARIFNLTQGLPLFIEEIAKVLLAKSMLTKEAETWVLAPQQKLPIPDTIRDAVLIQLENFSAKAIEKLEVAAAYGLEFDLSFLLDITGDDVGIDELLQTEIIKETTPGKAIFRHSVTRQVVKDNILWSKRRQICYQIAEYLSRKEEATERLARFWYKAGEPERARLTYVQLARQYCRVHAHSEAIRAGQLAFELWKKGEDEIGRLEVLEQLAHCAQVVGRLHESIMALRELAESEQVQKDPSRLGEVYRSLAIAYSLQSTWLQYQNSRKMAAQAFEKAELPDEAAKEWLALASRYVAEFGINDGLEASDQAIALARKANQPATQARAMGLKGYLLAMQGKIEEGRQIAHEAVNLALAGHHKEAAADAYRRLAGVYEYASQFDASIKAYETALNFCRANGVDMQAQLCLPCMSWVLFRLGDWKKALHVCKDMMENPDVFDAIRATAHGVTGLIKGHRGESKSALLHIQQCQVLGEKEHLAYILLVMPWAKAVIHEHNGEFEAATLQYQQLMHNWEGSQDQHDILAGLIAAAAFFGEQKEEESLNKCLQIFSKIAQSTGNPEALGGLSFALGEMALLQKNYEDAISLFDQAVSHFEELNIPLQVIIALYRKGCALKQLYDQTDEAQTTLQQALNEAKALGLRPLAAKIETVLECLQKPNPKTAFSQSDDSIAGSAGLTDRQMEILQEVAEGLSNKEIASKLYLSTRTVDMHVGNILNRLNCRSRAEAVKVAAEKGLI